MLQSQIDRQSAQPCAAVALRSRPADDQVAQPGKLSAQGRQAFEHAVETLSFDQRADRHQHRPVPGQSEPLACRRPIHALESRAIDAIADDQNLVGGHSKTYRMPLERLGHGKDARGPLHRLDHPAPPERIARQRHLGAAQGDAYRNAQPASEQRRRMAFRIREVGIDDAAAGLALEPQQQRQTRNSHAKPIEPLEGAGHREKAWAVDLDAFLHFRRRCRRPEMRPPPAQQPLKREPWNGGDDRQRKQPCDSKHAFADEQAGRRLPRVRKERAQDNDPGFRLGHRSLPPRP